MAFSSAGGLCLSWWEGHTDEKENGVRVTDGGNTERVEDVHEWVAYMKF